MHAEFGLDNKGGHIPRLTKGMGIRATDISAKSVFAHSYVRLSYICSVKSGKIAPRRFPVQSRLRSHPKPSTTRSRYVRHML